MNAQTKLPQSVRVSPDFPGLPKPPVLTIEKDQREMDAFYARLSEWYKDLQLSIGTKFDTVTDAINSINRSSSS